MKSNQIIIVSGLQRSGTSMMMQMLEAGGITPIMDNMKKADQYNPNGYYEHTSIYKPNIAILDNYENNVLKVYAKLLPNLPEKYSYKIIFMTRDTREIFLSRRNKNIRNKNNISISAFKINQLQRIIEQSILWAKNQKNVDLLEVAYLDVLNKPSEISYKINKFLNLDLAVKKMASAVDKKLHTVHSFKEVLKIDRSPLEVVSIIEKYSKDKIYCEVGIGEGDNLNLVKGMKQKLGVEIAPYGVNRCKEKYPHLDVKLGSILDYLPTLHFDICFMWLTYPRNKEIVDAILHKNENTIVLMGLNYFYHIKEEEEKYKKYINAYTKIANAPKWNQNINTHLKSLQEKGFDINIETVEDEDGEVFSVAVIQKKL